MKICNQCNEEKKLVEFSNHPKGKFGKHPTCKSCRNAFARNYYVDNSERILASQKVRDRYNPDYERQKKYGLSKEQFQEMLKSQTNKCKICGAEEKLVVDHSHMTGKVRGLLCHKCNRGLGQFNDNIPLMFKAIEYLRKT